MLRCTLLLLLSLVLVAPVAEAQSMYRWVDDEGEIHYGQSVPPEFKDYGYVRLGPDGRVRERVEPALSPEEIAERRRQRAEEAEREAEQRSRETRDRMLLATYGSEQELEQALQLQLAGLEGQRASTRKALELVENRFEKLVARAAGINREGGVVPESLRDRIEDTRSEMRDLRTDLQQLDQRESDVREEFSANLERYRELTSQREQSG